MITNRIKLTHSQITKAAQLLAHHMPAVHGCDVQSIATKLQEKAIDVATDPVWELETDTFTISSAGYVMLVWTLPPQDRDEYGYDREVEVLIDPSAMLLNDELSEEQGSNTTKPPYIRYIHMRYYTTWVAPDGTVVGNNLEQRGGVTIAFIDNFDGTLTYSIARCNKHDLYVRRVGRELAKQRLLADDNTVKSAATFVGSINQFRPWIEQQIQQLSR